MKIERFYCFGCDGQTYHEKNLEGEYECLECGETYFAPTRPFQGRASRDADGDGAAM